MFSTAHRVLHAYLTHPNVTHPNVTHPNVTHPNVSEIIKLPHCC